MRESDLPRFTFVERVVHWVVGVTFVVLLLTGLAFSYPALYWLTLLLGGGAAARALHPWVGVVFTAGAVAMFWLWAREMAVTAADRAWLRAIRHYVRHDTANVSETAKYNGGQKLFFWLESGAAVVLLATGIPVWVPDGVLGVGPFSAGAVNAARLLHYLAALAGGLLLIPHIYLGTVAYPGTARGMLHGTVSRAWARLHHPLWHRESAGS